MGFFVKNVENVQGDERDIIVFSTTFGRNAAGDFRRFGVLGQTGGERRLNVAITRARRKVIVVTSMPINEISDMLTTHRTVTMPCDYLQAYLEYARALSAGEFDAVDALRARPAGNRMPADNARATDRNGFRRVVGGLHRRPWLANAARRPRWCLRSGSCHHRSQKRPLWDRHRMRRTTPDERWRTPMRVKSGGDGRLPEHFRTYTACYRRVGMMIAAKNRLTFDTLLRTR